MRRSEGGRRSSLGLIVLGLLAEEPMHAYRMQKLIRQRGKDRVVNVRARQSLYQTIERLVRLELAEVRGTVRGESHPDRIVYAITDAGRAAAVDWHRQMLSLGQDEFPEFVAAVSMLVALPPDDARQQLERRMERLVADLAETEAVLGSVPDLPRLFLLDEEYRRALLAAELTWVRSVVADLRAGRLDWDESWRREVAERFDQPVDEASPADAEKEGRPADERP
ncbi:PadR family transcriptional regulator [Streptosporangium sp. KLBMP 9127]|nr:PadR family transcriptional regulator [Streptosporangium sp. KLBMP 9127]